PEVSASPGSLDGRLEWPRGTPFSLASLNGRLHMQLEQGSMHAAGADAVGMPFALLAVPALASGLTAEKPEVTPPEVAFARVSADYAVGDGQVQIRDLHFDGDTEILVRGRAGLLAHDYDAQAWILRGEERLPAALRRF